MRSGERTRAIGRALAWVTPALLALLLTVSGGEPALAEAKLTGGQASSQARVRVLTIHYRAHNGARRAATVLLPASYVPRSLARIPLVISPHGRGVTGRANARIWGSLPASGGFAVVSPDGQGRKLPLHSWGYSGQIADLARMPVILERTLPWLRIDRRRVFAVGGSMGGQEALLLLARHPRLLAGVAVFDPVVDLRMQYRRFRLLACNKACRKQWRAPLGDGLRDLAGEEIGGTPKSRPTAYRVRSPLTYVRAIANSCVPLQIWWSVQDRVVSDPFRQAGRLFSELQQLNPDAPVSTHIGFWRHTAAMRAGERLPIAIAALGLLDQPVEPSPSGLYTVPPPESVCAATG